MKVFITNCAKNSKYHYTNLIADAFESLGHRVFRFDSNDYHSSYLKIDQIIRRSPLFYFTKHNPEKFDFKEKYRNFIGKQWINEIKNFKPDFLLLINSAWVPRWAIKAAKENLHIRKMVCWVVDDPGITAAEGLVSYLPYFDKVFCIDREWLNTVNFFNQDSDYLPLGTSDICYKPLRYERDLDFMFVGSFFKNDPQGFLRSFVIANIPLKYKVEIHGPGINYFKNIYPQLNSFKCFSKMPSIEDLNKLYNRAKITPTIYHPQVISGTSPRVFEAAFAKSPQVIQYTSSISELFPGIKIPTFKNIPEFLEKSEYYLNHPKEREELAGAMYEIALKNHKFIHRIDAMLKIMNLV